MLFRALASNLHSTADGAVAFMRNHWGIRVADIEVETPIIPEIGYVTTLHARMKDHHLLCIEVSENAYTGALDPFVLECHTEALPVKLFVATPPSNSQSFQADLARARRNGV